LPSSDASATFTSCPSLSQQCKIFSTLRIVWAHRPAPMSMRVRVRWCVCVRARACLWGRSAGFRIPIGSGRRVDDEVGLGAATQAGRGRVVKSHREALHAFRQGILACDRTSPLGSSQQHHAPAQERSRPRRIPGESEYMISSVCSGRKKERRRTKNEERRGKCLVGAALALSAAGERCSSLSRSPTYSPAAALDLLTAGKAHKGRHTCEH
jgi:hypothetical protein